MSRLKVFLLLIVIVEAVFAGDQDNSMEWNGYAQFRAFKNKGVSEGFMIRRTKLWIKGSMTKLERIHYKVMGIFTYNKSGFFGLLDAYGGYHFNIGYLRIGQQIPEFSLEREQPDWKIPMLERAAVINRMIPAAQSFARDIGMQARLNLSDNTWHIAAGIFNGDGANLKQHNSENFLYNLRTSYDWRISQGVNWHLGASLMYRHADNDDFSLIFGQGNLYSGNDFRYGLETLLNFSNIDIQGEYIEARFGSQKAFGYYTFVNYNVTPKDQVVASVEQLHDLNPVTLDDPWFKVGYNRLFIGHNLKLMAGGGSQFNGNYSFAAQIQIFFN